MPIVRNLTGEQFGKKIKNLFELINQEKNWEQYVSEKTALIVKTLYKNMNMTETLEELEIKYPTARAHILRALDRIENHKLDYLHKGQSEQAQKLFKLMNSEDWETVLTDNEVLLAKNFKELKNFYEVSRKLNVKPGNIAATLYGSTQKLGVIFKLEQHNKQLKI
jgi:DNA-binding CsgD family transcriptional regulator